MKVTYGFATDTVELEVEEEWGNILIDLDRQEYNSYRKHSRRHPVSLEDADFEGEWFADGTDLLGDLIRSEDREYLRTALAKLKPAQRELIEAVYFKGVSVSDQAAREGVDHSAISHRLRTAYKNLKKLL